MPPIQFFVAGLCHTMAKRPASPLYPASVRLRTRRWPRALLIEHCGKISGMLDPVGMLELVLKMSTSRVDIMSTPKHPTTLATPKRRRAVRQKAERPARHWMARLFFSGDRIGTSFKRHRLVRPQVKSAKPPLAPSVKPFDSRRPSLKRPFFASFTFFEGLSLSKGEGLFW